MGRKITQCFGSETYHYLAKANQWNFLTKSISDQFQTRIEINQLNFSANTDPKQAKAAKKKSIFQGSHKGCKKPESCGLSIRTSKEDLAWH